MPPLRHPRVPRLRAAGRGGHGGGCPPLRLHLQQLGEGRDAVEEDLEVAAGAGRGAVARFRVHRFVAQF